MPATADRPYSAAAEKNSAPLLEVLRLELKDGTEVLEIGSGTGQHDVRFAAELPALQWQTSDLEENHRGIQAWIDVARLDNVRSPLALDVSRARLNRTFDAVFSANTAHIMAIEAVLQMLELVGKILRPGGVFCLYGPFRLNRAFTSESNARFDQSLRSRDATMGIRDLEVLETAAIAIGLQGAGLYAMPSNNLVVVWRKARNRSQ